MRRPAAALIALAVLGAQPGAAVELGARTFYVGAIGRTHDASASDPRVWLGYELEDWKDPGTGTTAISDQRCGLHLKYRLLGNHRRNYLEIEAQADPREGTIHFDPHLIRLSVGAGSPHEPGFSRSFDEVDIGSGDSVFAAVPFTDKNEFSGANEIHVRVPFGDCVAETAFKRPAGRTESAASGTQWSRMQLELELGSGIGKTGNLKDLTSNGIEGGLAVTRYPWMSHGFWLGLEFQSLGGPSGVAAVVGYSYRHYFSARWTFHYDIAPGIYEFSYAVSPQQPQSLSHAFLLTQRVGLDWVFGRIGEPAFLDSDHALGILFSDDWLPGASLAGNPAAGQNFSLLFRYLFGL